MSCPAAGNPEGTDIPAPQNTAHSARAIAVTWAAMKSAIRVECESAPMCTFRSTHHNTRVRSRAEIPVRHDLQEYIDAYIDAAGPRNAPKDTPLFQRQ